MIFILDLLVESLPVHFTTYYFSQCTVRGFYLIYLMNFPHVRLLTAGESEEPKYSAQKKRVKEKWQNKLNFSSSTDAQFNILWDLDSRSNAGYAN